MLEKRVYENPESDFKLKNEKGEYINPKPQSSKLTPWINFVNHTIWIPSAWDKNQAAMGYSWELQNAANFKKGSELSPFMTKEHFVTQSLELEAEAYITSSQFNNETYPDDDL